jgi:hypothetical protein
MSFMDGCKPQGPLAVLTPEERRVTDYYQSNTLVDALVAAVIEDLRADRLNDKQLGALSDEV